MTRSRSHHGPGLETSDALTPAVPYAIGAAGEDDAVRPATDGVDQVAVAQSVRWGIWVSALRCILTYVVAPLTGGLAGVLGIAGLCLQCIACVVVVNGTRQLWLAKNRWRLAYLAISALVVWSTMSGLWTLARRGS